MDKITGIFFMKALLFCVMISAGAVFAQGGDTLPSPTAISTIAAVDTAGDQDSCPPTSNNSTIAVSGMIIDSLSGVFPANRSISVCIDTLCRQPDAEGNFSLSIPRSAHVIVELRENGAVILSTVFDTDTSRASYFLTCLLGSRALAPATMVDTASFIDSLGPPWTLSGRLSNARLDIDLDADSLLLLFDRDTVYVDKDQRFSFSTRRGGRHVLTLSAAGQHTVTHELLLTAARKQVFVSLGTTARSEPLARRQITVSARRQALHERAESGRITVSRNELMRSAGSMNDPLRVIQTLPGVVSSSDASARPVVRGGDVLESRIFLDGIPLMQPWHFGGARSCFIESSVENLTLYKTGFPAQFHNAQAAVISVDSRDPLSDSVHMNTDVSMLQFETWLGIPIVKDRFGAWLTAQGSYLDFMEKRAMGLAAALSNEKDAAALRRQRDLISFPDYKDVGGGIVLHPSSRMNITIGDQLNTDRFYWMNEDSLADAKYYTAFKFDPVTGYFYRTSDYLAQEIIDRLQDTLYVAQYPIQLNSRSPGESDQDFLRDNGPRTRDYFGNSTLADYDSAKILRTYADIDTTLLYKSRSNLLHGSLRYAPSSSLQINAALAWQHRWWDVSFPHSYTEYISNSRYKVTIDQQNLLADATYSGIADHRIKAGLQLDLSAATYDVNVARPLHEIIVRGNTNFSDFWGPMTHDTASQFFATNTGTQDFYEHAGMSTGLESMKERLLVKYKGTRSWLAGALFISDDWKVNERLRLSPGLRIEATLADSSIMFSPRLSASYQLANKQELVGSAGLYTQNNYEPDVLALSERLQPQRAYHASLGHRIEILPWLNLETDIWGKYQTHLAGEVIEPKLDWYDPDSLAAYYATWSDTGTNTASYEDFVRDYLLDNGGIWKSSYRSDGRGVSFGGECALRWDPVDWWNGWANVSVLRSMRQRHSGWRWHSFPLERPVALSIVNYYRLPRSYEVMLKYRYMMGMPYTAVNMGTMEVGDYNAERYAAYSRVDLRIAKGFNLFNIRGSFYFECLNAFNRPNFFLRDRKTGGMQSATSASTNLPFTQFVLGTSCAF